MSIPRNSQTARIDGQTGEPGLMSTSPAWAVFEISGTPCLVRHWTATEWLREMGEKRPDASELYPDDRGGMFAVTITEG